MNDRNKKSLVPVATQGWIGIVFDNEGEGPIWRCPHLHLDLDSAEECANAYIEEMLTEGDSS